MDDVGRADGSGIEVRRQRGVSARDARHSSVLAEVGVSDARRLDLTGGDGR
jgi:hypothetical protein